MPIMESVTLENFRCFRERQTVGLAPLTLLVGENSTGKTSFLALVRILAELQEGATSPDFKAPPFDLGSFDEIAYAGAEHESAASSFIGGFGTRRGVFSRLRPSDSGESFLFEAEFQKQGPAPVLTRRSTALDSISIDERLLSGDRYQVQIETPKGKWRLRTEAIPLRMSGPGRLPRSAAPLVARSYKDGRGDDDQFEALDGSPPFDQEDLGKLDRLLHPSFRYSQRLFPFASAPVRSTPHRTYDPAPPNPDPEGNYIPMYLADLSHQRQSDWKRLKSLLEEFGKDAELFDEIVIRQFDRGGIDPFQIQVRKGGRNVEGPPRNLIDVGYGVSQVLPVITELRRRDAPRQYLLQQPEVHLHPRAQAALGSLFCEIATLGRQLIVETHSDHLLDRIRMDVRDGRTDLTLDDVRILYFERDDLDVKIHEIWWDKSGNVMNSPPGYRRFFMEEVERSIWPPD